MHPMLTLAQGTDAVSLPSIINSILGSLVAIAALAGLCRRWVQGFARREDVKPIEDKLDGLDGKVDRLAADVHEVRGHQTGLADRVTRVETRMDDLLEPRRRRGWGR